MVTRNTYRILIWIIVILVATNLSMGLSFWYHKHQENKVTDENTGRMELPSEQRTRFFRDQLDLNIDQMDQFRNLNREFNRNTRVISDQLEAYRVQMVDEMGKEEPSKPLLDSISVEIGELHTKLKEQTINYYLGMKAVCNSVQQEKLKEIFLEASKAKEDVELPQRGRGGFGRGPGFRNQNRTDTAD